MTGKTSIFVIDDEPDNFDVIEAFLCNQDYAASDQEVAVTLASTKPDLILLDVMMPEIDGMEVCRQLNALPQWASVPIIMVTALTTKNDVARCLTTDADDFVTKPINSTELRIKHHYDCIKDLWCGLQEHTITLLQNNLDELCSNLGIPLPHKLNIPLHGVMGVIDLLCHGHQNMSAEKVHDLLDMAKQSAQKLESLTKRFLRYSKLKLSRYLKESVSKNKGQAYFPTRLLIENRIKAKATSFDRLSHLSWCLKDIYFNEQ